MEIAAPLSVTTHHWRLFSPSQPIGAPLANSSSRCEEAAVAFICSGICVMYSPNDPAGFTGWVIAIVLLPRDISPERAPANSLKHRMVPMSRVMLVVPLDRGAPGQRRSAAGYQRDQVEDHGGGG